MASGLGSWDERMILYFPGTSLDIVHFFFLKIQTKTWKTSQNTFQFVWKLRPCWKVTYYSQYKKSHPSNSRNRDGCADWPGCSSSPGVADGGWAETGLDKVGHVGKIEKCKERARRGLETPLKQRLNFLANVAMIISWVGMGLLMSWDRTNPWRLTSTSHFLWISLLCYLIKKLKVDQY